MQYTECTDHPDQGSHSPPLRNLHLSWLLHPSRLRVHVQNASLKTNPHSFQNTTGHAPTHWYAASFMDAGPSSSLSGNPCPRLMLPCLAASWLISSNIVVGRPPNVELKPRLDMAGPARRGGRYTCGRCVGGDWAAASEGLTTFLTWELRVRNMPYADPVPLFEQGSSEGCMTSAACSFVCDQNETAPRGRGGSVPVYGEVVT